MNPCLLTYISILTKYQDNKTNYYQNYVFLNFELQFLRQYIKISTFYPRGLFWPISLRKILLIDFIHLEGFRGKFNRALENIEDLFF